MDLAIPLIAGLVGAFLTYLFQVILSVQAANQAAISDQIDDLRRIEALATEYWLTEAEKKQQNERLAAQLRGAIMASSSFEEVGPRILGCRFKRYTELTVKLDEIVTGGDFESERKNVDYGRVAATMRVTGELVSHLRFCRTHVFTWK